MGQTDNETIVKQIQTGNGDRKELLTMLWLQNTGLIRKIIHASTGLDYWRDQDFEDLEQQAFLGILESLGRYDGSQGIRFFTYAKHYIVKSVRIYCNRFGQVLRIPPGMKAKVKRYIGAREEWKAASGQYPTDSILREYLGMSEREFRNVSDTARKMKLASLDSYLTGSDRDSSSLIDMIPDPAQDTEKATESVYLRELHQALMGAFATLTKKECEIIYARYYLDQSVTEIAGTLGCTDKNVNYHLKAAFRKIRQGKFGPVLASFLPRKAEKKAERKRARKYEGLTDSEKDLLL